MSDEPSNEPLVKIHVWAVIAAICSAVAMGFSIHIANVLDHGLCLTADVTSAAPSTVQLLTTGGRHLVTVLTGGKLEGDDR